MKIVGNGQIVPIKHKLTYMQEQPATPVRLEDLSDDQLNLLVAQKVLGWSKGERCGGTLRLIYGPNQLWELHSGTWLCLDCGAEGAFSYDGELPFQHLKKPANYVNDDALIFSVFGQVRKWPVHKQETFLNALHIEILNRMFNGVGPLMKNEFEFVLNINARSVCLAALRANVE